MHKYIIAAIIIALIIIVVVVAKSHLESMVNPTRTVTLHYTNWCGACKNMKPVWSQVKIATAGSGIVFKEVDEAKAKTPGVDSYPTIYMLDERGRRSQYGLGPDFERLRNWVVARH